MSALDPAVVLVASISHPLSFLAFLEINNGGQGEVAERKPPPTLRVAKGQVTVALALLLPGTSIVVYRVSVKTQALPLHGGLGPSTTLGSRPQAVCRSHSSGRNSSCSSVSESAD